MDFLRFSLIFTGLNDFEKISEVPGPGCLTSCGGLWRPVRPESCPLHNTTCSRGASILQAWLDELAS